MAGKISLYINENIAIPVKLEKSADDLDISFSNLAHKNAKNKEPITRPAVNSKDEVLDVKTECSKGIKFEDNWYSFTKVELDSFNTEEPGIQVKCFVPISTLQINHIMSTYYIVPDKKGQKGYALFAEQMADKGLMAVCKVFEKGRDGAVRDRISVVRPFENGLIFHHLFFSNEVRPFSENITVVESTKQEKDIASDLIDSMTEENFNMTKYHNEYNERVMVNVRNKAKKII